ncbi:MAG: hypothetical protein H0U87_08060 [Acidobacteria bacterium]|nr:hypothetical protein [Acidobacteriota bacterium]
MLIFNLSCGKRKPPLPPVERVSQKVVIDGFQRGNFVTLGWTMPDRNAAAAASILRISRVDVYRLAESLNTSQNLTEEEFAAQSTLIASLPVSDNDFGRKKFTYTDRLEFAGQAARLRYAIRFVNSSGQQAAFSNFLLIEPTAKISEAPQSLKAGASEAAVILEWIEPTSNIDDSKPVNLIGYNVYRSESAQQTAELLNKTPIGKPQFFDKSFEFNKKYFYFVRAVSLGGNGEPVESRESNIADILPRDVFAPSAPTAITIAAAPNNLSIFFAANPEKDIAGYTVYRSTDKVIPLANWQNLTSDRLLKTNTFNDTQVESGKTYYYYLTAVDEAGNVSATSEIVSETAP